MKRFGVLAMAAAFLLGGAPPGEAAYDPKEKKTAAAMEPHVYGAGSLERLRREFYQAPDQDFIAVWEKSSTRDLAARAPQEKKRGM